MLEFQFLGIPRYRNVLAHGLLGHATCASGVITQCRLCCPESQAGAPTAAARVGPTTHLCHQGPFSAALRAVPVRYAWASRAVQRLREPNVVSEVSRWLVRETAPKVQKPILRIHPLVKLPTLHSVPPAAVPAHLETGRNDSVARLLLERSPGRQRVRLTARPPGTAEAGASSDGRRHPPGRRRPALANKQAQYGCVHIRRCGQSLRRASAQRQRGRGRCTEAAGPGAAAGTHVGLRVFFHSVSSHLFCSVWTPTGQSTSVCETAPHTSSAALSSRARTPLSPRIQQPPPPARRGAVWRSAAASRAELPPAGPARSPPHHKVTLSDPPTAASSNPARPGRRLHVCRGCMMARSTAARKLSLDWSRVQSQSPDVHFYTVQDQQGRSRATNGSPRSEAQDSYARRAQSRCEITSRHL